MASTLDDDPLLKPVPLVEGWKVLAPVVLYAKIGQGGMGAVYRGRHIDFDIDVAVKCLKPSLAAEDEQFISRFRREARLAASLTHENLVRVYDYRRSYGIHYLVMEFIDGETSSARVKRKGQLGEYEAAAIILGAARGLAKAHRNQETIVHRDIKPDNIMISRRGEVKLADLGIAKAMEQEESMTLNTQGVIGTPQYMSPEQWDRDQSMGPQSDIWSFGATLYFFLSGENAIRSGTERQVYTDICQKPFPDVRKKRADVSPELLAILGKCMQKDMKERYADAGELADALAHFIGQKHPSLVDDETGTEATIALVSPPPLPTMRKIRTQVEGSTETGPTPAPVGTIVMKRGVARWWWIGGGVAAAALAVTIGVLMSGKPKDGDAQPQAVTPSSAKPINARLQITEPILSDGRVYLSSETLKLRGSIDNPQVKEVRLYVGTQENSGKLDARDQFSFDVKLPRDRTSELRLVCGDFEQKFIAVQDSTEPTITILEPAADALYTSKKAVDVVVQVLDTNLDSVKLDGRAMSDIGGGKYELKDLALGRDGDNAFEIVASDKAGHAPKPKLVVVRDQDKPRLTTSSPSEATEFEPGTFAEIELIFSEKLSSASIDKTPAVLDGSVAKLKVAVPKNEGEWLLAYEAFDLAKNSTTNGTLKYRRKSKPAPKTPVIVVIDAPNDGKLYLRESSFALKGSIKYFGDEKPQLTLNGKAVDCDLSEGELSGTLQLARNQISKLELKYGSATPVVFDVIQDSEDPKVTLVSPTSDKLLTNKKKIDLVVRVEDQNLESVLLGGRDMKPGDNSTWRFDQVDLPNEGLNTLTITAKDRANRQKAVPLSVTRDTSPPQLLAESEPTPGTRFDLGSTVQALLVFSENIAAVIVGGVETAGSGASAAFSVQVPASGGDWKISGKARDLAGNEGAFELKLTSPTPAAPAPVPVPVPTPVKPDPTPPVTGSTPSAPKPTPDPGPLPSKVTEVAGTVPKGWKVLEGPTNGKSSSWAAKVQEPTSGIVFVLIDAGSFDMGSPPKEKEPGHEKDEILHRVTLTRPFYMAESETTQLQYRNVIPKAAPSKYKGDKKPVESVTWKQADEFCQKIGCELPTEAQWEYACRAGSLEAFSTGSTLGVDQARQNGKYAWDIVQDSGKVKGPADVMSFRPNAWKLWDMHGNVAEWCRDGYAPYSPSAVSDPLGPNAKELNLRGGGWMQPATECRSANRDKWAATEKDENTGFRCVKTLP